MNISEGSGDHPLSGSDVAFAAALRETAVFSVRGPHRLLFRAIWLRVDAARAGVQVGYQFGWR